MRAAVTIACAFLFGVADGFPADTADPQTQAQTSLAESATTGLQEKPRERSFTNSIGMELVWLPRDGQEGGYWVGKHEVTQDQYHRVMGVNPSYFKGNRRPAENVGWLDAQEFVKLLTQQDHEAGKLPPHHRYSLPTERQWEYYVADATLDQAIHKASATADVGTLQPNKFGLYDVRGNVLEWTLGEEDGYKVLRGACWVSYAPVDLETSYRYYPSLGSRDYTCGLRVVLVPAE